MVSRRFPLRTSTPQTQAFASGCVQTAGDAPRANGMTAEAVAGAPNYGAAFLSDPLAQNSARRATSPTLDESSRPARQCYTVQIWAFPPGLPWGGFSRLLPLLVFLCAVPQRPLP